MHDAGLRRGGREYRLDRLRKALAAVDAGDEDVSEAAVAQFVEDLHPELRALGVLEPQAEHVARAVQADRHRQVARLALHAAAVADLQDQAVQENDWVDVLQRP